MADHDLLDEQSRNPLPIGHAEGLDIGTQAVEKRGQRLREPQVSSLISNLSVQCLEFVLQALLTPAQFRHPATQFVQGEQIFLIRSQ